MYVAAVTGTRALLPERADGGTACGEGREGGRGAGEGEGAEGKQSGKGRKWETSAERWGWGWGCEMLREGERVKRQGWVKGRGKRMDTE